MHVHYLCLLLQEYQRCLYSAEGGYETPALFSTSNYSLLLIFFQLPSITSLSFNGVVDSIEDSIEFVTIFLTLFSDSVWTIFTNLLEQ